MATAGAQWLIERGVVDPRRLREMPSVKRRRFEEIAEAIRGESLGAPALNQIEGNLAGAAGRVNTGFWSEMV